MPTPKLTLSLTVHEVNEITQAIEEVRAYDVWNLRDQKYTDDDGRVIDYRVTSAERALAKRDRLADIIESLTGHDDRDTPETRAALRDARKDLDAQTAADQVAEAVEV